jgi:putative oxidoreductase
MSRKLNIALWIVQVLLALAFALTGSMKLMLPPEQLAPMFGSTPVALVRFIGVAELAAVVGLLLPSLTRILPVFTPLAAIGLATVMVCAVFFHISRSEWTSLPGVLLLGVLAAFTAWGRLKRAPIQPRTHSRELGVKSNA